MAQTEHLPILRYARCTRSSGQVYKAAYDPCLYLEQVVRTFSRDHKYSLGQDLGDGVRRILKLIVRGNARREKARVLLQIREEAEEVLRLVRNHESGRSRYTSASAKT